MQTESKSVAVHEVNSRNEILSDSLEKIKNELLNTKKILSGTESERFDLEKENMRIKKDVKKYESQLASFSEEKEHLIQMLELKNHLIQNNSGSD